MPASPREFELQLLGFVCLADPLRADVPHTLAECSQAGIRVVMITGDHPGTALAIATQAGFNTRGGVLTGRELESMDDEQLRARVAHVELRRRPVQRSVQPRKPVLVDTDRRARERAGEIVAVLEQMKRAGEIALAEKRWTDAVTELSLANQQDPYNLYRLSLAYAGNGEAAKAKDFAHRAENDNTLTSLNYAFVRQHLRGPG